MIDEQGCNIIAYLHIQKSLLVALVRKEHLGKLQFDLFDFPRKHYDQIECYDHLLGGPQGCCRNSP